MRKAIANILLISVLSAMLSGCMSYTAANATKSPCDEWATGCGQKTKVNQW